MIRIVVLGSSASVPSVGRSLPSIGIRYEGDVYLFDCGEGTQRQMMKFGMSYSKVKAIFITHLHADHLLGIPGLVHTLVMNGRSAELSIYGPAGIEKAISRIVNVAAPDFPIKINEISSLGVFLEEKDFTVSAFMTEHGTRSIGYVLEEREKRNFDEEKARALGIKGRMFGELEEKGEIAVKGKRITIDEVTVKKKGKKIVYTGDTMPSQSIVNAARGADVLIYDGTFSADEKAEAKEKMHSTVSEGAEIAKEAEVKKLLLVHISSRYKEKGALEEEAKKIFKNSVVAEDGMEILL